MAESRMTERLTADCPNTLRRTIEHRNCSTYKAAQRRNTERRNYPTSNATHYLIKKTKVKSTVFPDVSVCASHAGGDVISVSFKS
jgi:hypothetical protein